MVSFSLKFSFYLVLVCIALTSSSTTVKPNATAPAEVSIDDASSVNGTGSSIKKSTDSNDPCSQFKNSSICCSDETANANNCSWCLRIVNGTDAEIGCGSAVCAADAKNFCDVEEKTESDVEETTDSSNVTTGNGTDAGNTTTAAPDAGNTTTVAPTDNTTTTTTTPPVETTTTNSSSSNTTTPEPATTTVAPVPSNTTTVVPSGNTTTASGNSTGSPSANSDGQQFDGASFIGGIILCGGLVALIFFGLKFYKGRKEQNYHTL